MKMVDIQPVPEPKSFKDVKFTKIEWEGAAKLGKIRCPYVTAMENIRQSKGLYQIVPDKLPEVELKVGGLSLDEMSNVELKLLALKMGVTIRKKNISRSDLVGLVKSKMDEIEVTDDEEEDVSGSDEASGD